MFPATVCLLKKICTPGSPSGYHQYSSGIRHFVSTTATASHLDKPRRKDNNYPAAYCDRPPRRRDSSRSWWTTGDSWSVLDAPMWLQIIRELKTARTGSGTAWPLKIGATHTDIFLIISSIGWKKNNKVVFSAAKYALPPLPPRLPRFNESWTGGRPIPWRIIPPR